MLPSSALVQEFAQSVRARGSGYIGNGSIEILSGSTTEVTALVQGSDNYFVGIARIPEGHETRFEMSCTCPFALDRAEPCKHMWAVLCVAERAGHLGGFDGAQPAPGAAYAEIVQLPERDEDDPRHRGTPRPAGDQTAGHGRRRNGNRSSAFFSSINQRLAAHDAATAIAFPFIDPPLRYVLDRQSPDLHQQTQLHVMHQRRTKSGALGVPKIVKLSSADMTAAPQPDRRFLALLSGARRHDPYTYWQDPSARPATFLLSSALALELLPDLAAAGRLWFRPDPDKPQLVPLTWDDGPPWSFEPEVAEQPQGYVVRGTLRRGDRTVPLGEAHTVPGAELIVMDGAVARFEAGARLALFSEVGRSGAIEIAKREGPALAHLLARMDIPATTLPTSLQIAAVRVPPQPRLSILGRSGGYVLSARLSFDYDGAIIARNAGALTVLDAAGGRIIHRQPAAELRAATRLSELGFRPGWAADREDLELKASALSSTIRTLVAEGWYVEAEGARYRASTSVRMSVSSGIDWFDLSASVEFGDSVASLPAVLAALKTGAAAIRLDDGTLGVLPEDWLRRHAALASAGEIDGDRIRFRLPQAALLDALLADREAEAAISVDQAFARVRTELEDFSQVAPLEPPHSFVGTLRPYQRDGLGWFAFLRRFGFGGCLADDMGLGKTVMVLALLESRRLLPPVDRGPRASLIVVPRSLIGNWMSEAATFTPELRVLDHSRGSREWDEQTIAGHDLILATYGTLRRDITVLRKLTFDYVVLDEAQAIKNAGTAAAKAARLLRAQHRLALSGTPIENHLGELWSLFEFLNPGVLGRSSAFQKAAAIVVPDSTEVASVLSRGLRPFILRRTKQQVARDLPARTEQTIVCELSAKERALYDGLKQHYRDALLDRVDRVGMARSKLQVLEALLRLRQAACHTALVDRVHRDAGSAKFDVLLPRLREVLAEGHKAIVFSQFTSLLALLREALDAEGVVYEYLDGKTRDREAHVARFQTDPSVGLFLISLKAGGVGLNLTAAEYVFLLDPWWNPAVEAQAIDRTHRIGQTREVFAYRLIAKDTVEEKVLALQQSKRDLADAVLSADAVGLRHLQREDLELLLE